jgi:predicted ATPase
MQLCVPLLPPTQVLEARFPEVCATQPELVAQHYTEAGLSALAVVYWQRAGRRASERSAYVEAISHLRKGLEVLQTLPDTPVRTQQELELQTTLGPALIATKGYGALEVAQAYTRARELCRLSTIIEKGPLSMTEKSPTSRVTRRQG